MRTREAKHFLNPDGSMTGVFQDQMHYLDDRGLWQDVDLSFHPIVDGHVADRNDVIVRVTEAGVSAVDRRTGAGVLWHTPEPPVVDGRQATFSDQGLRWTYATRASGIKLTADVAAARGPRTYAFSYALLGLAEELHVDAEGNLRGAGFTVPRAVAFGADRHVYSASAWRLLEGNRVAFDFDDSALPPEAFPYELDPTTTFSVGASGDDGEVYGSDTSYPPSADFTGNYDVMSVERTKIATTYAIDTALMRWNTSSIPDDAWLSAVDPDVILRVLYVNDANVRGLSADWYTAWPIDTSDYSTGAPTSALTHQALSTIASGSDQFIGLENHNGVSQTGYTGVRFHVNGGAPTGSNIIQFASYDNTTYTEPRLEVNYFLNAAPNFPTATDSPDPVEANSTITFQVGWDDPDPDDLVRAVVCKTNSISAGTCPGGTWATSGYTSGNLANAFYTATGSDVGANNYYAFACDDSNLCSSSVAGTFTVNPDVTSAFDSPDPVYIGSSTTLSASFSSGQAVKAAFCKTNIVTSGPSCPGGTWATAASFSSSSPSTATYTPSTLDVGTNTYHAFVCTSGGLCSSGNSGTFTVKDPPNVTSASDTPDPVDPGNPITFSVGWNSSVETVKAVVCKTNAITQEAGTCPGGAWATGTASATSPSTATYTTSAADSGLQTYYAFACTAGNACSSTSVSGTFQVNDEATTSVAVMTPPGQVATVGGSASVTVHVEKTSGGPLRGRGVTFTRTGANPGSGSGTTDLSGDVVHSYTGATVGADVIRADVNGVPTAVAAGTVAWRPAVFATEVVFDPPVKTVTKNTVVTMNLRALKGDGTPFQGTVYYGVAPFGPPPAKAQSTTTDASGNGSFTFTPNTSGVWTAFAYADRPAPDSGVGAQDGNELDGAAAVISQEPCGTSSSLVLTPPADTRARGGSQTVTATVRDNCGQPKSGATVNFARTGANAGSGSATTDGNGQATHSWTGTNAGVDRVDATVSGASVTATPAVVVWTDPAPTVFGTALVFTTPIGTGPAGSTVDMGFVAKNHDGSNFSGTVRYRVANAGSTSTTFPSTVTVSGGTGSIPVTVSSTPQQVLAFADSGAGGTAGARDTTELPGAAAVVAQVACGSPTVLVLTPPADTKAQGGSATVTATVRDNCGNLQPGVTVSFARTGANAGSGSGLTNASGQATHTWTGTNAGLDQVQATVAGAPTATGVALVEWTGGPPPAEVRVLTLTPVHQTRGPGETATLTAHVVDQVGAPVSGATVRFSRSGATGPATQDVPTNAGGDAVYAYPGSASGIDTVQAAVVGSATAAGVATVEWVPSIAPIVPPSNGCDGAGTAVVDGFTAGGYVKLRFRPSPVNPSQTWVCAAVDNGIGHAGLRLIVGSPSGTPFVDDNQAACDAPANVGNRIHHTNPAVGPNEDHPLHLDVNKSATEVWVCLELADNPSFAKRLVVPLSPGSGVSLPDLDDALPYPYVERAPTNPALPSSACQLASSGRTRLLNADVGPRHAWLYGWQQSSTKANVCVRAEGGNDAGGRLTVDGNGNQTVLTTSTDLTPCTFNIVTDDGPPPFSIKLSPPANGAPASVCLSVDGTNLRATIAAGTQSVVTWAPDS